MLYSNLILACAGGPSGDSALPDSAGDTDLVDSGSSGTDSGDGDSGDTGKVVRGRPLGLGIPAYAYPSDPAFDAWVAGVDQAGGVVILNPASGVGAEKDSYYSYAVGAVHAAGGTVLGYVSTAYGTTDTDEMYRDIGRYFAWYEVDGIFFDEVPGAGDTCITQAEQYEDFANVAHQERSAIDGERAFIAFNPGTDSCEEYMELVDAVVIVEQAGAGIVGWVAQDWVANYPSEQFWLLAHETSAAELPAVLQVARDNNIGLVYVTDDVLPNPWDALPTYFDQLVADIVL